MDEEIKELLEKNLEYSKEIYRLTKKIKAYITFQKVMSVIYILLIIVPIILSIIFLPPLLKGVFDQYKEVLGFQAGGDLNLDNFDTNKLPAEVRKILNK